jgi:hypothetical protein
LKEFCLFGDKKKCSLFEPEVEFCGHLLGGGQRKPSPGKLLAVQKWGPPPNISALRAFLGVVNYYSSYVPMFADSAAPFMEKLKVDKMTVKKGSTAALQWQESELEAFRELKIKLLQTVPLRTVQPDEPFLLKCDASDRAVGAVLEQIPPLDKNDTTFFDRIVRDKEKCTRPVAFLSRKLAANHARTWTIREKETYAIVCALKKWATWVGVQPIVILTDHKSLENWTTELLKPPQDHRDVAPVGMFCSPISTYISFMCRVPKMLSPTP